MKTSSYWWSWLSVSPPHNLPTNQPRGEQRSPTPEIRAQVSWLKFQGGLGYLRSLAFG